MHLSENTTLQGGKYSIIRTIGQGGFGITYLAVQAGLNRAVVIKEFFMGGYCYREGSSTSVIITSSNCQEFYSYRDSFIKEARNIATLYHPNIVRVIDVFEENNTAYYVMEYHSGGSLSSLIRYCKTLSENDALYYIRQIASALKYVHANRMLHLDIKPDNILVDEEGNAVLIDFGLSKHYDPYGKESTSTPIAFSRGYSPKEQYVLGGVSKFSPATDIYSLGATLFNLLTGELPPESIVIDESDYILCKLEHSKISDKLKYAVIRSMSSSQKDRPQSIDEFMSLLNVPDNGNKNPFNWKPFVGILVAILCTVLTGVGINNCYDYRVEKRRLEIIEELRLDSIAEEIRRDSIAKQQQLVATEQARQDSIDVIKRYNDSIAKQQQLIAIEQARQDSIDVIKRYNDSIANIPGKLYVTTNPVGATVTVDGKRIGNTPIDGYSLKRGNYTVKIAKNGYNTVSKNITISNDPDTINIALTTTEKQQTKSRTEKDNQSNKPTKQEIEKYYNNGEATYILGRYTDAVDWYRKAAEQGHAKAQHKLGICYETGSGVTKNLVEAVKWYRKAAEQGYAQAQCALGFSYEFGKGVTKDLNEATKWYQQAANKGYMPAIKTLHRLEYKKLTFNVNGVLFTMIAIKGGKLHNEQDNHSANLYDYYLCETEVTQELWEAVMGSNHSYLKGNNNPVENINFNDCISFLKKLNDLLFEQLPYALYFTLPTIDEWEYAARGGNKSKNYKYSGSNNIDEVAWYNVNSGDKTHPVKSKQPNELGLYDMSGNVMEWCLPCYREKYNPNYTTFYRGFIACGGSYYLKKKECHPYNYISLNDKITSEGIGLRIAISGFNTSLKYIVRE